MPLILKIMLTYLSVYLYIYLSLYRVHVCGVGGYLA